MIIALVIAFLTQTPAPPQRIVAASNVRLRSAPQTSAEERARLPLGTVVAQLEVSSDGLWFRVEGADGRTGWISGSLSQSFSPGDAPAANRRVLQARLAMTHLSFADGKDLFEFVSRIEGDPAELALFRLLALERSVAPIMEEEPRDPAEREWVKIHENEIAFSVPGGQWFVRADLYWALEEKHRGTAIAQQMAWEGANAGLPGECEGYIPCTFEVLLMTDGRYLDLYPTGAHADQAMEVIASPLLEIVKPNTPYTMDPRDAVQLRGAIAKLSAIVERAAGSRKAEILANLKRIDQMYR